MEHTASGRKVGGQPVDDVEQLKEAVVRLIHAANYVLGELGYTEAHSLSLLQVQVDIGKNTIRNFEHRRVQRKGAEAAQGQVDK